MRAARSEIEEVCPRHELWALLNSLYQWRMFLLGYACAIYQRAVQTQRHGHKKNPGHLDLWSATYLPICDFFVTHDRRQRGALKVLNKANPRPAQILSYAQWRERLMTQAWSATTLMGHMSRAMLERYSHVRMAAKREAVMALSLPDLTKKDEVPKVSPNVSSVSLPS
jgi:hypothetical protein